MFPVKITLKTKSGNIRSIPVSLPWNELKYGDTIDLSAIQLELEKEEELEIWKNNYLSQSTRNGMGDGLICTLKKLAKKAMQRLGRGLPH